MLITAGLGADSMSKMVNIGEIRLYAKKPTILETFINQVEAGIELYKSKKGQMAIRTRPYSA